MERPIISYPPGMGPSAKRLQATPPPSVAGSPVAVEQANALPSAAAVESRQIEKDNPRPVGSRSVRDEPPPDGLYSATIHFGASDTGPNLCFVIQTAEGEELVDWLVDLKSAKGRSHLLAVRKAAGLMSTADDAELDGKAVRVFCKTTVVQDVPKLRIQKVLALGTTGPASPSDTPPTVKAECRRFSDIVPQEVEWLWNGRIPLGKLTVLAGDPETGKALVSIDAAARVSTGRAFPDGSECKVGSVLILSAEDDAADTLRPRLDSAGADVTRVHIVDTVRRVNEKGKDIILPFNLATDLAALADRVKQIGDVRLIIVDPISAYLGSSDSHVNAQVRALLAPLAEFAAKYRVAVVAITHLSKGQGAAIYRAIGSIAFVAAARAAWMFAKDPHDPERRLMLRLKNNLAGDIGGLAYRIEPAGPSVRVVWEPDPLNLQADEVINMDPFEKPSQRQEAAEFIRAALADGPHPANEVITKAKSAGISLATLKRARSQVGVVADKAGFTNGWTWSLPDKKVGEEAQPDQQTTEEAQHPRSEPLRENNHKEDRLNQQLNRRSSHDKEVSPFAGEKVPKKLAKKFTTGNLTPFEQVTAKKGAYRTKKVEEAHLAVMSHIATKKQGRPCRLKQRTATP